MGQESAALVVGREMKIAYPEGATPLDPEEAIAWFPSILFRMAMDAMRA
jgi:hypothetical protein